MPFDHEILHFLSTGLVCSPGSLLLTLSFFSQISAEFRGLKPVYQEVISDVCRRMGEGMTVYLDKAPDTLAQWDEVNDIEPNSKTFACVVFVDSPPLSRDG